jgi:hypothetical protein
LEGQDTFLLYPPNFDLVKVSFSNWSWYIAIWLEQQLQQHTFSFVLFLGYDTIRGSCWSGASNFRDTGSDELYEKWTAGSSDRNYFDSGVAFNIPSIEDSSETSASYDDPADVRIEVEQRDVP